MKETGTLKDPKTCRIFFSSPFGGMEEEREELTKFFFPRIHHACNAKGIKFVPVDMRWGITKEAADNAQVMNICLREIERSDFFVGFFGQRYGWHSLHGAGKENDPMLMQNFDNALISYPWVDDYRERSMTEVEWYAGHLNNPGKTPSCFCFRDKEYDDAMCLELEKNGRANQKYKFTCENEYASERLQSLIQAIEATEDKTYGVKLKYKTPAEGAKFIFDKIFDFVTEVVLKDVNEDEMPRLLKLRQVHDQFAKTKAHLYCGCQEYYDVLDSKINAKTDNSCQGLLVTGLAGCGKSSLLATWVQSLQTKCPHLAIIYHYIGCAPGTERPTTILERLLLELKSAFPTICLKSPEPSTLTPRNLDSEKTPPADNKTDADGKAKGSDKNLIENEPNKEENGFGNAVNGLGDMSISDENSNRKIENLKGSNANGVVLSTDEAHMIISDKLVAHQAMSEGGNSGPIPEMLMAHQSMSISHQAMSEGGNSGPIPEMLMAHQSMSISHQAMSEGGNSGPIPEMLMAHQSMSISHQAMSEGGNSGPIPEMLMAHQSMSISHQVLSESGNSGPIPEMLMAHQSMSISHQAMSEGGNSGPIPDASLRRLTLSETQNGNASDKERNMSEEVKQEDASGKDQNVPEEEKTKSGASEESKTSSKEDSKGKGDSLDEKSKVTKDPEQKKTSQQLLSEVNDVLKTISENGRQVVIIIDALNQQQKMEKTKKHLYWLPASFPKEVTFVCSTLDSDERTHDLLVKQRGMETLAIKPYNPDLQLEICVESLKVSGKELSPHQLNRIVNSNETTNPLFLKLIIYELSIYGSFRKLDEKIDSLIYVNGVKPLLQVILSRLEEDYNAEGYSGSLVKDVLCCIIASKKGVSESEIVKILSIPLPLWSPLFFALERLLVQYTGLLGFAFAEMRDAVIERYLSNPSEIISYKKRIINYFDDIRKTMKPWEKNTGLEYNRVLEELPWLQQDIQDNERLVQTLSDISIMRKLVSSNCNDLLELWQSTGTTWSVVTSLYMKAFDDALVCLYNEQQEGVVEEKVTPGSKLRVVLQYMRSFFDVAYYPDGNIQSMKREIKILENCDSNYTPEKKAEYLRDSRYYLAVAYSDRQNYTEALPLYFSIMEECENILKEKKDDAAEELLAYSCNGTGLVYYGSQDHTKALEYLQRAEAMHKKRNEKRHQASSKTNIGLVYINQKEYEKALEEFGEAQKLYEDHFFGDMPIEIGNLLTNIALTYRRMKDLRKAEEYYHKSLEVKAKNVGWYHPVIAVAYMNLGTLEVHRKNHAPAEVWTRKAIDIYERNEVPVTDRSHRMCRENLCMNMLKQNKKEEVLPLYLEVTNILVDNGWIGEAIAPLHRDMIEFIIEKDGCDMYKQVEKILLSILASPKRRAYFAYHLITLDELRPKRDRPDRPEDLKIENLVKEFPMDSKMKLNYVTEYLAEKDLYEEIMEVSLEIHAKEERMKESAFSFAADALVTYQHYESAKKMLLAGFERYPGHLELIEVMIECLVKSNEVRDLIPYVPLILEADDWECISQRRLMMCAEAVESIEKELAFKCYNKILHQGSNPIFKAEATKALRRLAPYKPSDKVNVPSAEGDSQGGACQ